jgi:hypothetical protein
MTEVHSPHTNRSTATPVLLAVIAILLALNPVGTNGNETHAQQQPAGRTAIGVAVCPHPQGNAPNVYRIWSDGTVEVSTGTDRGREAWKRIDR